MTKRAIVEDLEAKDMVKAYLVCTDAARELRLSIPCIVLDRMIREAYQGTRNCTEAEEPGKTAYLTALIDLFEAWKAYDETASVAGKLPKREENEDGL